MLDSAPSCFTAQSSNSRKQKQPYISICHTKQTTYLHPILKRGKASARMRFSYKHSPFRNSYHTLDYLRAGDKILSFQHFPEKWNQICITCDCFGQVTCPRVLNAFVTLARPTTRTRLPGIEFLGRERKTRELHYLVCMHATLILSAFILYVEAN